MPEQESATCSNNSLPNASTKAFTVLENNPSVMNELGRRLGLSKMLSFYDVYSLHDPDLLAMIPRPVYALLTILPLTEAWKQSRTAEDASMPTYDGYGPEEPVTWFKQAIPHGCGLIGFLHCVCNGAPQEMLVSESELSKVVSKALPLRVSERAQLLNDYEQLFTANEAAALLGDSRPMRLGPNERVGQHFVAFVKGQDGHLWELEGSRKGPVDRGELKDDEDALSSRALALGLERLIEAEQAAGSDMRFSCIALAPASEI